MSKKKLFQVYFFFPCSNYTSKRHTSEPPTKRPTYKLIKNKCVAIRAVKL